MKSARLRSRIATFLIPPLAILALILAWVFALGTVGFFLAVFVILLAVLLILTTVSAVAIRVFGRERVETSLSRCGMEISFAADRQNKTAAKDMDGIEDTTAPEKNSPP